MRPRSRLYRATAALGSLISVTALLVGPPIALRLLAKPAIPSHLPSKLELWDALAHRGLSDAMLIQIVAVIGWLAWLQVAFTTLVEAISFALHRSPPRLAWTGPIQPTVHRLVASVALVLSSARMAVPSGAAVMPISAPAAIAPPHDLLAVRAVPIGGVVPAAATPVDTSSPLKRYTVERYDTLWDLADNHLGDPLRWRELHELNVGRRQADGLSLDDHYLMQPGWDLLFPADAVGLPPATTLPGAEPPPAPPPATVPVPATADRGPASNRQPPPTTPPVPTESPAPTGPTTSSPTTTAAPAGNNPTETDRDTDADEDAPVPWRLITGGLAAAGLVTLLNQLRRVQQRKRTPGTKPSPPEPELEEFERRLRRLADLDAADRLDLALRAFAAGATRADGPPPAVQAVRVSPDHVELLLDRAPDQPPNGFSITDIERGWIADPARDLHDLRAQAADIAAPLASLVAVGELDGDPVLIDIETVGLLTVDGPAARPFITSVMLQLATAAWIDHVDVVLVTADPIVELACANRVRRVPDLRDGLTELCANGRSIGQALDVTGAQTTYQARLSEHHNDGWIPTVLICTESVEQDVLDELEDIVASGGRGMGAVVASTSAARWHATADHCAVRLAPLGFCMTASLVEAKGQSKLDELLTDTMSDQVTDDHNPLPSDQTDIACEPFEDPPYEIEARVLGPVEIAGIAADIERRRAEELVAYLALHPRGASDERIKTVLWPDNAPTVGTFNTTVTMARTSLGNDGEGNPHLPHYAASERVYRVGPFVTTDLDRFKARVAYARRCPPDLAIDTLRSALELVRGMAFEGTRGYEWAYSEHIVASAEAMIADTANDLANRYLDAGDHEGATWAALQGLKACPADEGLYRARMKASHLAGDTAGIRHAFDELCRAVEALEPYDTLQHKTVALRRQLLPDRAVPRTRT